MSSFVLAVALLSQPVTLRVVAAPAPDVVAQIARAAGIELACDKRLATEYLCVSVKDAPTDDLLAHVAKACQAKWTDEGGHRKLVPDFTERQRRVTEAQTATAVRLKKNIAELVANAAGRPETPVENRPGAGVKALAACAQALGPSVLAGMAARDQIVYSTAPTAAQRPFPAIDTAFLANWVDEYNRMADAATKNPQPAVAETPRVQELKKVMAELGIDDDAVNQPKRIDGPPAKVLLVVSKMQFEYPATWLLRLSTYDQTGRQVTMVQATVNDSDGKPDEKQSTNKPASAPIKWSESTQRWFRVRAADSAQAVTPDDAKAYADVVNHEPLANIPSDLVMALADEEKANIVAALPDEAANVQMARGTEEKTTVRQLAESYGAWPDVSGHKLLRVEVEPGWWTIAPRDQEKSRATRVNRAATSKFLARVFATKGAVGLDSLADFVAANDEPAVPNATAWLGRLFEESSYVVYIGDSQATEGALRLYGLMNQGQRRALRSGQAVPFTGLGAGAVDFLRRQLYRFQSPVVKLKTPPKLSELELVNQSLLGMSQSGSPTPSALADEPTEYLPNGLDMRGQVYSQLVEESYFEPATEGNAPQLSTEILAVVQVFSHTPGLEGNADGLDKMKFHAGTRSVVRLRAEYAPKHGLQGMLIDPRPVGAAEFTMATMPSALKAELDRKASLIEKSPLLRFLQLSQENVPQAAKTQAPPP